MAKHSELLINLLPTELNKRIQRIPEVQQFGLTIFNLTKNHEPLTWKIGWNYFYWKFNVGKMEIKEHYSNYSKLVIHFFQPLLFKLVSGVFLLIFISTLISFGIENYGTKAFLPSIIFPGIIFTLFLMLTQWISTNFLFKGFKNGLIRNIKQLDPPYKQSRVESLKGFK